MFVNSRAMPATSGRNRPCSLEFGLCFTNLANSGQKSANLGRQATSVNSRETSTNFGRIIWSGVDAVRVPEFGVTRKGPGDAHDEMATNRSISIGNHKETCGWHLRRRAHLLQVHSGGISRFGATGGRPVCFGAVTFGCGRKARTSPCARPCRRPMSRRAARDARRGRLCAKPLPQHSGPCGDTTWHAGGAVRPLMAQQP